jgi:diguanylate cyclase (GGDEF)-like protein
MIEKTKSTPHELTQHEAFLRAIDLFNATLARGWRTTAAQIAMVLAAMGAALFAARAFPENRSALASTIGFFFVLLLSCNVYQLFLHDRLKDVRSGLLDQLHIAITQSVRTDELYGLSILDPLTGLHNRRFGEERLHSEIVRAERNGDPLSVILIDLDHFKGINDQFGHAAGDSALKEFSWSLARAIRACDVPVRMGGDEFLLILPECPRDKADLILSRIGIPQFEFNSQRISIGYSAGRAHYQTSDTIESLLGRADGALYVDKSKRAASLQRGYKRRDGRSLREVNY